MLRSRTVLFAGLVWSLLACGGGGGGDAKSPGAVDPDKLSIGDLAARQGGLSSLGGGSGAGETGFATGLHLDLVEKEGVKLDGLVKEWPARAPAKTVVKGTGDKVSAAFGLQYDDQTLYVAGEIGDPQLTRSARFADDEDHATLVFAVPSASGMSTYEIAFFAGKPGESAGSVRWASGPNKGHEVAGAKIVEAPVDKGYTFEASLPWSTFPETRTIRVGLHGLMRYFDSEGGLGVKTILATGPGDAAHAAQMPALLSESEQSLAESFLSPRGLLATTPKVDLYADITGDGMKERITVFDHYLTIVGPGYRAGREFFYRDLGAELVKLEARDVTGRGKDDLLVRRRFPGSSTREWFEVWSFLGGSEEPTTTFAHEVAVVSDGKQVTNVVRVASKQIDVTYEPARGWDVDSYREPVANDVEPILLPWGPIKSQVFRFDKDKFKKDKEVPQAPTPGAQHGGTVAQPQPRPQEPPTPAVKSAGDVGKQILDHFKADRSIAAAVRPRFDVEVNVAGDARPERVAVFGRDIVVFGPGFKGGNAYAYLTLSQFSADADVKDVSVRDLTGDGGAEVVIRGVRHVAAAGQGTVDMDVLFVYQVKNDVIARIFGIETGREQAGKRVQGMVQFIPAAGGKSFDIDVQPGRATGWTDKTYPWGQDAPGGATEPLLLPWGQPDHLKYTWSGTAFVLTP